MNNTRYLPVFNPTFRIRQDGDQILLSFDSGPEADQNRQSCFIRLPATFSELHIDVSGFESSEPDPGGRTDCVLVKGEIHAIVDGDRSCHLASPALLVSLQDGSASRSLNPFARRADTSAPPSAAHIRTHIRQQVSSAFDAAMGQYMMSRGTVMDTLPADDGRHENRGQKETGPQRSFLSRTLRLAGYGVVMIVMAMCAFVLTAALVQPPQTSPQLAQADTPDVSTPDVPTPDASGPNTPLSAQEQQELRKMIAQFIANRQGGASSGQTGTTGPGDSSVQNQASMAGPGHSSGQKAGAAGQPDDMVDSDPVLAQVERIRQVTQPASAGNGPAGDTSCFVPPAHRSSTGSQH